VTSRPLVLGHRGGRGEGWPPENTLEAFARALAEGADGVELDVRLARDGTPVVAHDPSLSRVTHGRDPREVRSVDFADLPPLASRGDPGASGGAPRIPSLAQALDLMAGKVVNVELKGDVRPGVLALDAGARLRLARAAAVVVQRARPVEVVFSSFDPLIVLSLVAIAPRIPRAILVGTRMARASTALALSMRAAIQGAHLEDSLLTARRIERLRASGLAVRAWTVNDPARAAWLAGAGVSAIITDDPRSLREALEAPGEPALITPRR